MVYGSDRIYAGIRTRIAVRNIYSIAGRCTVSTNLPQLTPAQLNYSETAAWKTILKQALTDLRVSIPAIIESFDPVTQCATVQVAINEIVRTQGGPQNISIKPINKVPVCFPSAGGFSLTLPLQPGDEGLLIFCDMCIDLWWARGGIQNQLERRRHDLSDCGFYPGGRSQPRVLPAYSPNSVQLRSDDGTTYLEVAPGGLVNIVAPGGVNIIGNLIVSGEVTGNAIPLSTHIHGGVQTGGGVSGPPEL